MSIDEMSRIDKSTEAENSTGCLELWEESDY